MRHQPMLMRISVLILVSVAVMANGPAAVGAEPIELIALDGDRVTLESLTQGRPTLLVFWATWCAPCRSEIPRITEAHRRFADEGLQVLGINPAIRDTSRAFRRYAETFELVYPVYFDYRRKTPDRFRVTGTPTIILLDAEGTEVTRGDQVPFEAIVRLLGSG